MEQGKVYNIMDFIDADLHYKMLKCFDLILKTISENTNGWKKYPPRSKSVRLVTSILLSDCDAYDGGCQMIIPECLISMQGMLNDIIQELWILAQLTITDSSRMIPIEIFLSYYRDGKDTCPMHSHKYRQITLSIGADRTMIVGSKKIKLSNGSVIFLNKERHGIPEEKESGNRLSFNMFFTTDSEM